MECSGKRAVSGRFSAILVPLKRVAGRPGRASEGPGRGFTSKNGRPLSAAPKAPKAPKALKRTGQAKSPAHFAQGLAQAFRGSPERALGLPDVPVDAVGHHHNGADGGVVEGDFALLELLVGVRRAALLVGDVGVIRRDLLEQIAGHGDVAVVGVLQDVRLEHLRAEVLVEILHGDLGGVRHHQHAALAEGDLQLAAAGIDVAALRAPEKVQLRAAKVHRGAVLQPDVGNARRVQIADGGFLPAVLVREGTGEGGDEGVRRHPTVAHHVGHRADVVVVRMGVEENVHMVGIAEAGQLVPEILAPPAEAAVDQHGPAADLQQGRVVIGDRDRGQLQHVLVRPGGGRVLVDIGRGTRGAQRADQRQRKRRRPRGKAFPVGFHGAFLHPYGVQGEYTMFPEERQGKRTEKGGAGACFREITHGHLDF